MRPGAIVEDRLLDEESWSKKEKPAECYQLLVIFLQGSGQVYFKFIQQYLAAIVPREKLLARRCSYQQSQVKDTQLMLAFCILKAETMQGKIPRQTLNFCNAVYFRNLHLLFHTSLSCPQKFNEAQLPPMFSCYL